MTNAQLSQCWTRLKQLREMISGSASLGGEEKSSMLAFVAQMEETLRGVCPTCEPQDPPPQP